MKYKIGDKVKVKENCWEEYIESSLKIYDYVLTIKEIAEEDNYYRMKETETLWDDDEIEHVIKPEILEPILSRFEILDL